MKGFKIGDIIRKQREALDITQEALCLGVCDISTLSRIERNQQFPSQKSLVAILERLDLDISRFMMLFTEEEFEVTELWDEIVDYNAVYNFEKAAELLERLEQSPHAKERVMQQFIMRSRALPLNKPDTRDQFIEKMIEVIAITIMDFNEDEIEHYLLGSEETKCIMNLAHAYAQKGERRRAIKIYEKLLSVMNKPRLLSNERAKIIPLIAANLSKCLNLERRYEEAIEVCDSAKEICIKKRQCFRLPSLLANKGCALFQIGKEREAVQHFELACAMYLGLENLEAAESLILYVKNECQIELTFPECYNGKPVSQDI